jgi:DNA-binding LacI/PurR family transcriptional regulator
MRSSPPAFSVPRRVSLAAQATDALRQAIISGNWSDFLPSERRLCELLQVSRPTIRKALSQLAQDGVIAIHQGRRNRLLGAPPRSDSGTGRLVAIVTPEPVAQMPFATYRGVSEMRTHLAEQGFATEALVCPPGSPRLQRRKLEEFFRQTRVSCCVLLSVSRTIQQWFDQNRMPALVLGSCHPGVRLPSIDFDYRTICRHAAGILLARGHRRLALVVPDSGAAGDLASEQGFREAADRRTGGDVAHVTIVRHNGTAQQVTHKLDSLFRSPHPPTALLVAKTQHVFVVLMYLLRRGLQVPDAVSFIARDHDPAFVNVIPQVAHYSLGQDTYVQRLSRLMLQLVNQGSLPPEPNLIFPRFCPGGTLRRLG